MTRKEARLFGAMVGTLPLRRGNQKKPITLAFYQWRLTQQKGLGSGG
jgi:hypothetical protein